MFWNKKKIYIYNVLKSDFSLKVICYNMGNGSWGKKNIHPRFSIDILDAAGYINSWRKLFFSGKGCIFLRLISRLNLAYILELPDTINPRGAAALWWIHRHLRGHLLRPPGVLGLRRYSPNFQYVLDLLSRQFQTPLTHLKNLTFLIA